jgi:hypothetical protein
MKKKKLVHSWDTVCLDTVQRILQFTECTIDVRDISDFPKLFGKRKASIHQIFTQVSFENNIVPFWSQSKNIFRIKTFGWNSSQPFTWLNNWRNLKELVVQLRYDLNYSHELITGSDHQMKSLVGVVSSLPITELDLYFNYLSLDNITQLEELVSLKLLTLRLGKRRANNNQDVEPLLRAISKLPCLTYLSLQAFEISINISLLQSLATLDLGLKYPLKTGAIPRAPLIHLKSLTLRQLYPGGCFESSVVQFLKMFTAPARELKKLHVHYRQLKSVCSIVQDNVLPRSIRDLSFEASLDHIDCHFHGIDKCKLLLDTLYISGYDEARHVIRSIMNQVHLRTIGLGRARLDHSLAKLLTQLPSLRMLKIEEGFIENSGLVFLNNRGIIVEPGCNCNVDNPLVKL